MNLNGSQTHIYLSLYDDAVQPGVRNVTTVFNPLGPNYTINFTSASLNAADWSAHIEAQTREGETIVIDGVLSDLGSYHRKLTGTWISGGVENQLVLTRE